MHVYIYSTIQKKFTAQKCNIVNNYIENITSHNYNQQQIRKTNKKFEINKYLNEK